MEEIAEFVFDIAAECALDIAGELIERLLSPVSAEQNKEIENR